jgi:energy-coupling factor transporter transmembrane protein EcfT
LPIKGSIPKGRDIRQRCRREGHGVIGGRAFSRERGAVLVEASPLWRADPRAKLWVSMCASVAVMLPLEKLIVCLGLYSLLLFWARLLPEAGRQVWRLKWVLIVLFVVDWLVVSPDLAVIVTLRLILLAGVFTAFVCTTSSTELRLALERLRVPYRYAFSLSLAFQSVDLLSQEWRTVIEAQGARGAWKASVPRWREVAAYVRGMVALTVPVIVLAARRAWTMTEAAYARGFDAPHRRPYRRLRLGRLDGFLIAGTLVVGAGLLWWPL